MTLDVIEFKAFKLPISKTKRKEPTNICKISFLNKGVNILMCPVFFMIHH